MRHRFDDGFGAWRWVRAFENAAADENTIHAQLHHQSRIGWRRYAASGKIHDRQTPQLRRFRHQFVGCADFLGVSEQLVRVHRRQLADCTHHAARVTNGLDDIASARFALGADHGGPFGDAAQRLA